MFIVDNNNRLEGVSGVTEQTCALYGSTNKTGSVPSARNAGPVYSKSGELILSESFTDLKPVPSMAWFDAGLKALLSSDDYVETWRIWDCYEQDWADIALEMHRFEMFDLVIRRQVDSAYSWRGAVDTQARVLASSDPEESEAKCWQWLRAETSA